MQLPSTCGSSDSPVSAGFDSQSASLSFGAAAAATCSSLNHFQTPPNLSLDCHVVREKAADKAMNAFLS